MPRKNETSITFRKELVDRIKAVLPPGGNVTDFLKRWAEFGMKADTTGDLSGFVRALKEREEEPGGGSGVRTGRR